MRFLQHNTQKIQVQMKDILYYLLETLIVIVPMLLAVAFMTIIERKQLAAMQRRVGPNTVGFQRKKPLPFWPKGKRFYHRDCKDLLEKLYHNRKAPVIAFKDKVAFTCTDLLSPQIINPFLRDFKGKGGIYMFRYKADLNIYYIGRTGDFHKRFKSHLRATVRDRFHSFAFSVGWENFEFSIIEICDLETQQEREDYYLQTYFPLLNTFFKSNYPRKRRKY